MDIEEVIATLESYYAVQSAKYSASGDITSAITRETYGIMMGLKSALILLKMERKHATK